MTSIPPIDISHTIQLIENFIRTRVSESGVNGVIIGISGGIDSAVITSLAVRALGSDKVNAFFYPSLTTPSGDLGDVKELCSILGIKLTVIDIQKIIQSFSDAIGKPEDSNALEWMNLKPRIRQSIWYFYANKLNCLVCGSSNKSEMMIGYYTKFGDGAADILPIGDVYKTHVYQLAEFLDLPTKILKKIPSAGLFEGQTDESEIGMSYTKLDSILFGLELFRTDEEIADRLEIPISDVKKVRSMIYRSEHKRRGPIIFKLGVRTPSFDWRIPLVEPKDY
ncbi:MAG: NAD+ synthase [Candidatus Hodarchaeales archaeon]|jgi:NAD+ synthase